MRAIGEDQRVIVFANTKRQVGVCALRNACCSIVWVGHVAVAICKNGYPQLESTHLTVAVRRRGAHHGRHGRPYCHPTAHLVVVLTHSRAGFHSFLLQCDAVARIMDDLGYRMPLSPTPQLLTRCNASSHPAVRCRGAHRGRLGLPHHHAARRQEPGPARGVDQGGCRCPAEINSRVSTSSTS